jgi:hypothetical protein
VVTSGAPGNAWAHLTPSIRGVGGDNVDEGLLTADVAVARSHETWKSQHAWERYFHRGKQS